MKKNLIIAALVLFVASSILAQGSFKSPLGTGVSVCMTVFKPTENYVWAIGSEPNIGLQWPQVGEGGVQFTPGLYGWNITVDYSSNAVTYVPLKAEYKCAVKALNHGASLEPLKLYWSYSSFVAPTLLTALVPADSPDANYCTSTLFFDGSNVSQIGFDGIYTQSDFMPCPQPITWRRWLNDWIDLFHVTPKNGNNAQVADVNDSFIAFNTIGDDYGLSKPLKYLSSTNSSSTNYMYVYTDGPISSVMALQYKTTLTTNTTWTTFSTLTNDQYGCGVFIVPMTYTNCFFRLGVDTNTWQTTNTINL